MKLNENQAIKAHDVYCSVFSFPGMAHRIRSVKEKISEK